MLARRGIHKAFGADSDSDFFRFHRYNIHHQTDFVKHQFAYQRPLCWLGFGLFHSSLMPDGNSFRIPNTSLRRSFCKVSKATVVLKFLTSFAVRLIPSVSDSNLCVRSDASSVRATMSLRSFTSVVGFIVIIVTPIHFHVN